VKAMTELLDQAALGEGLHLGSRSPNPSLAVSDCSGWGGGGGASADRTRQAFGREKSESKESIESKIPASSSPRTITP